MPLKARVGAGKERVGGGEGKQPDDHRDKPTGGANGLRMNAGNLNAAGGDRSRTTFTGRMISREKENKHHDHQPRQEATIDRERWRITPATSRPAIRSTPASRKQAEGPAQPEITGQHAEKDDQHSIESNFNIAEIAPPVLRYGATFSRIRSRKNVAPAAGRGRRRSKTAPAAAPRPRLYRRR